MKPLVFGNPLFRGAAWWRMAMLAGLGASASCETSPPQLQIASKLVPVVLARVAPTAQDSIPPTAAQRGYHRYRGTLGGRPVQLELTVTATTSPYAYAVGSADLDGFFLYLDTGKGLSIGTPHGFPASRPLEIEKWVDQTVGAKEALLCTDQPIGPVLTGTYALEGKLVPFRVQEDYSDCLHYEVLREGASGPPEAHGEDTLWSSVSRDYLHLLGPDTLRPAWARLQCPPPARRQRHLQALANRVSSGVQHNQYLWLRLNEANLLAYTLEEREEYTGSSSYESRTWQVLFDLRTGRKLSILGQLQPGGRRRLHQLLTRRALADTAYTRNRDHWRPDGGPMPMPDQGFAVTPEGLVALYSGRECDIDMYVYGQTFTWADLRPLLRPDSPLRRLLKVKSR